jgi:VanZ family protein
MRRVSRYAPPLGVMALIFALSSTPDLSTGLGTWDTVLRKIGHLTVYGVLWTTLARALQWRRPVAAAAIAILYAISDEVHQSFVTGRHGTAFDVAIDAAGVGLAVLAWILVARRPRAAQASPT